MSLRCTKFRLIIYVYLKNKDELVTFYNDAKVTQIRKLENKKENYNFTKSTLVNDISNILQMMSNNNCF